MGRWAGAVGSAGTSKPSTRRQNEQVSVDSDRCCIRRFHWFRLRRVAHEGRRRREERRDEERRETGRSQTGGRQESRKERNEKRNEERREEVSFFFAIEGQGYSCPFCFWSSERAPVAVRHRR